MFKLHYKMFYPPSVLEAMDSIAAKSNMSFEQLLEEGMHDLLRITSVNYTEDFLYSGVNYTTRGIILEERSIKESRAKDKKYIDYLLFKPESDY